MLASLSFQKSTEFAMFHHIILSATMGILSRLAFSMPCCTT